MTSVRMISDGNRKNTQVVVGESFMICTLPRKVVVDDFLDVTKKNTMSANECDELLKQLRNILQEMIITLNSEISKLSLFFITAYINRSILQMKTIERDSLLSVLTGSSFAEMSLLAGFEKENPLIFSTNSLTERVLMQMSDANTIEEFFSSQSEILIFNKR